jgi:exonuclease III
MGNQEEVTVSEKKRNAVISILKKEFTDVCRMLDDDLNNLKAFLDIGEPS